MSLHAFRMGPTGPNPVFGENCKTNDEWAQICREARAGDLKLECGCLAVATIRPWRRRKGQTRCFAHRPGTACQTGKGGGGEGQWHIELKQIAKEYLESRNLEARFELGAHDYRADILVTNPRTKGEAIVEIQLGKEAPDIAEERMRRRIASGKKQIWFFADDTMLAPIPESVFQDVPSLSLGGDEDLMEKSLIAGLDAWLSGKLRFDTGEELKRVPVDILTVPVLCLHCNVPYIAPQYALARASIVRPDLPDIAIHITSRTYDKLAEGKTMMFLQSSTARVAQLRRPPVGKTEVHCPQCQGLGPEVRFPKTLAMKAPRQEMTLEADIRQATGLDFPRWRDFRPKKNQPVTMTEASWRKEMERLTTDVNLAAKTVFAKKQEEKAAEHRREQERKRQEQEEAERQERLAMERVSALRELVAAAIAVLQCDIDVDTWLTTERPFERSAADAARSGGWSFERLKERLERIVGLGGKNAEACAREIEKDDQAAVGLPIARMVQPWLTRFREERTKTAISHLEGIAREILGGNDKALLWLDAPQGILGGRTPREMLVVDHQLVGDLERDLRLGGRKWLETDMRRGKLYKLAVATLGSAAEAHSWMGSPLPGFPGVTPADAVSSESGFETCRNILLGSKRRKR